MKDEGKNIFSVFDEILPKEEKEKLLNQNAKVLWLTGLSGSGKTSIAKVVEKIRRIAEVSKLFLHCGVITINCFVSPTKAIRQQAKDIIGADNFLEIFIDTPLEVCEQRDTKGLYAKARKGEIKDFTGISAPFESPGNASLVVKTESKEVESSAREIIEFITPLIKYKA